MKLNTHTHALRQGLILVALMAFSMTMSAQHGFEIGFRGGTSAMTYVSEYGKWVPNINAGLDLSYKYKSQHYVGFRIGVSADFSQSEFKATNLTDTYVVPAAMEYDGDMLRVNYQIGTFREYDRQLMVSVPVQIGFFGNKWSFFVGPKLSLPIMGWYQQKLDYANLWVENTVTQVTVGSPTATPDDRNDGSRQGGLDFVYSAGNKEYYQTNSMPMDKTVFPQFMVSLAGDFNFEIPVRDKGAFGIGVYADFGMYTYGDGFMYHNLSKTNNVSTMSLSSMMVSPPFERQYESVLKANMAEGQSQGMSQLVSKYGYFACGIKLSYTIWNESQAKLRIKQTQRRYDRICRCVGVRQRRNVNRQF